MTPIEILDNPHKPTDTAGRVSVVEWYIKQRKGEDVRIQLSRIDFGINFGGGRTVIDDPNELMLLDEAFKDACNWYAMNKSSVKP